MGLKEATEWLISEYPRPRDYQREILEFLIQKKRRELLRLLKQLEEKEKKGDSYQNKHSK